MEAKRTASMTKDTQQLATRNSDLHPARSLLIILRSITHTLYINGLALFSIEDCYSSTESGPNFFHVVLGKSGLAEGVFHIYRPSSEPERIFG
jgi:hypothetical protein